LNGIGGEAAAALLQYLQEDASILVFILNSDGIILTSNAYAQKLLGLDPAGSPFTKVLVDFNHELALEALLQTEQSARLLNVTTAQGLPQTFYFSFRKLNSGTLAVAESNSLEIEQLRQNMTLLNTESANLNRELHKKNAELQKLDEQKNQFVGIAAHDLRNPIGAIYSLTSFLLEHTDAELNSERQEILGMIKVSSNFMLKLLDDLLTIAKIELGKLNLAIQATDFPEFVRRIVKINQFLADHKKIVLRLQDYDTLPPVPLDPLKIEQVLNNLISNAVKFTPQGGIVDVTFSRNADSVVCTVSDRGPGVPQEDIPNLFKAFAKIGVKTPEGEKSTGLGLSIAQKIVSGHGGTLWYERRLGGGSSFCFSLPLDRGHKLVNRKTD